MIQTVTQKSALSQNRVECIVRTPIAQAAHALCPGRAHAAHTLHPGRAHIVVLQGSQRRVAALTTPCCRAHSAVSQRALSSVVAPCRVRMRDVSLPLGHDTKIVLRPKPLLCAPCRGTVSMPISLPPITIQNFVS